MANINSKQHLFVMVHGNNGAEKREVKNSSSESKLYKKIKDNFETSVRRKNRYDGK